jgi:hypothetical protein
VRQTVREAKLSVAPATVKKITGATIRHPCNDDKPPTEDTSWRGVRDHP